ncbi:hypothetical protein HYX12_00605 [Candidatus Woesearchaeota archaeon]|nr:hypothetical protein [Candidatus Woesearchaeota archaeon]
MKKDIFVLMLIIVVGLIGCEEVQETETFNQEQEPNITTTGNTPATTLPEVLENGQDDNLSTTIETVIVNEPTIRAEVSTNFLYRQEKFTLTISAENEKGIEKLSFNSSQVFWNHVIFDYDCKLAKVCSNTWELITWDKGLYELSSYSVDSEGEESERVILEVNVGPYRYEVEGQCGDGSCLVDETASSCPEDCAPPAEDSTIEKCNSDYDCGSKSVCREGQCISVDCKTDSDCSGCRRCSYNSCVKCAQGPYGCSC